MKYRSAAAVLPRDLVERLQDYIQGEYLYIPAKKEQRRGWGELSGSRREIDERNRRIRSAHAQGSTIEELADAFFLSVYAIRKIIYQK